MDFVVLLYYSFTPIADPQAFAQDQRSLCLSLGLKGRILIGGEGLNGTVAGTAEATNAYKEALWADTRFQAMEFKESHSAAIPFPKLKIKVRQEIISLHDEFLDLDNRGKYISPEELQKLYEGGEEFYIVDARNNYESNEGSFKDAVTPDINHFRELPAMIEDFAELKDKKVVTYCTGGIRCEKATALLKQKGFSEVYQLHGGIVSYIMQYPNQYFQGDCYVFDDRMRVTQEELATRGAVSRFPQFPEPQ
jgi:UPF0176 protein